MATYERISGRLGNVIDLKITFFRNGIPTDPFAIRRVSIYRSAVKPENLIAEFPVLEPWDPNYPSPISKQSMDGSEPSPGVFHLYWDVPKTGIPVPDIFFDVWSYVADDPGIGSPAGSEEAQFLDDEANWTSCCERFWLYQDGFNCCDGLTVPRLGFEAMDVKFYKPEIRTLEVGIMPLPLYDYDYNCMAALIPQLKAWISIMPDADMCDKIVDQEPMRMGLRQGTYRTNPFVLQYTLDTSKFIKGAYKYQVGVQLPNGETRVSPYGTIQIG